CADLRSPAHALPVRSATSLLVLHHSRSPPYPLSLHDALPILSGPPTAYWPSTGVMSRSEENTTTAVVPPPCASSRKTRILWRCRSEEHTSALQSRFDLVCRLLL